MTTIEPNKNLAAKMKIRNSVRFIYDLQHMRIMTGNRLTQSFRNEESDQVQLTEEQMEKEAKSILSMIQKEFDQINNIEGFTVRKLKTVLAKGNYQYIKDESDYQLFKTYADLATMEKDNIKALERTLNRHPLYTSFLKDVKGCGPLMSAVIISEFDPYKARHVSSFYKYAGLDVVIDKETGIGEGRSKKSHHLEEVTYLNSKGEECTRVGITFNPFLKTKLLGVLGGSFLKTKSPYAEAYYDYKNRKTLQYGITIMQEDGSMTVTLKEGMTAKHIHNMANRYMVKQFIRDLWVAWREIEGLPVTQPYEVAKLGMNPHGFNY